MSSEEIFDSAVRSRGDLAGVFEYDGETGYFYLYSMGEAEGQKVLDSLPVLMGSSDFDESDISIRWDRLERNVGLFIRGVLWAAFDGANGNKYGGHYKYGGAPLIPEELARDFAMDA